VIGRRHPAHSSAFTGGSAPSPVAAAGAAATAVDGEAIRVDVTTSLAVAGAEMTPGSVISVGDFNAGNKTHTTLLFTKS